MDSGYLSRREHEEFARRIAEENERTNHRLRKLEEHDETNTKTLLAIERLATGVENLQKQVSEQGERLEAIEERDGQAWRNLKWYVLTVVLGAVIGYLMNMAGI